MQTTVFIAYMKYLRHCFRKIENIEQLSFNQWVTGSNPVRLTTKINDLAEITLSFYFFKRDVQRDK